MRSREARLACGLAWGLVGIAGLASARVTTGAAGQMASIPADGAWKPTHARSDTEYLGRAACAECHAYHGGAHPEGGMALAAEPASGCRVLEDHPVLELQVGRYHWRIERRGEGSVYRVSDGRNAVEVPVRWCFGRGEAGQTWILERDGELWESRVSYYLALDGLDFTMGAPAREPGTLDEAVGRRMPPEDARDCFACHTTGAVRDGRLDLSKLTPGVTCEGCHGPGGEHATAMRAGQLAEMHLRNPGRMPTEEQTLFCGSCHRTWQAITINGPRGVANVRFQPYRITNSACYDAEDRRIACTACHDVHRPREREPAAYDAACLACHAGGSGPAALAPPDPAPACPESGRDCVSCHMPRYEIPGSHFAFTDHLIRVQRPGDPYPD